MRTAFIILSFIIVFGLIGYSIYFRSKFNPFHHVVNLLSAATIVVLDVLLLSSD